MKYLGKLQGAAVVTAVVIGLVGIGAVSAQAGTDDDVATWSATVDDSASVDADQSSAEIDDESEDQTKQWQDIAAEWHEAFNQIKADFAACRAAATDGAADCAHEFRYAMQVNHVKAWLARHEAKLGDISALPADQQAKAQKKLERQRAHAQAKLDKAAALLERQTHNADDEAEADDADDADADSSRNSDDKKVKNPKGDKPNRGHHGSAGNHGKSGR